MNNKKGFTLVELLAVISILAIIVAIAIPTYSKIMESVQNKQYQNKISYIKTAALKYADDTNYSVFYIEDLLKNGYIEPDYNNSIIDNRDNKTIMNCYMITITETLEQNYATIDEIDHGSDDGTCSLEYLNANNQSLKILIKKKDGTDITSQLASSYWINEDVDLSLWLNSELENMPNKIITWYRGLQEISTNSGIVEVNANDNSVLQQNYTVKVEIPSTEIGKESKIYQTTVRIYIDKIKPKLYDSDAFLTGEINQKWEKKKIYDIKAYDDESGIYGYYVTQTTCDLRKSYYKNNKKIEIKNNGNYKSCVMDNAGNVFESDFVAIDKIDQAIMGCNIIATPNDPDGDNGWYKNSVSLKVVPDEVGPSGITIGLYESMNSLGSSTFTYAERNNAYFTKNIITNKNTTYYGHVKNQTNREAVCEKKLKVETSITVPVVRKELVSGTYKPKYNITYGAEKIKIELQFDERGQAISGIKKEECRLFGNNKEYNGTVDSNGNCIFENVDESNDTFITYTAQKCIKSNAGNIGCSETITDIKASAMCKKEDGTPNYKSLNKFHRGFIYSVNEYHENNANGPLKATVYIYNMLYYNTSNINSNHYCGEARKCYNASTTILSESEIKSMACTNGDNNYNMLKRTFEESNSLVEYIYLNKGYYDGVGCCNPIVNTEYYNENGCVIRHGQPNDKSSWTIDGFRKSILLPGAEYKYDDSRYNGGFHYCGGTIKEYCAINPGVHSDPSCSVYSSVELRNELQRLINEGKATLPNEDFNINTYWGL